MATKGNVMVCVTQQKTCERLIRKGSEIRDDVGGKLMVIHVTPTSLQILGNYHQPEALDYLYEISKSMSAEMTVIRSKDTIDTLETFAKKNEITTIVLGESLRPSKENTIVTDLQKRLGKEIEIKIVPV
ncbi:Universal stress protein family protein [Tindallia magadiensis]|uniref:Universal stress protein family protein n=1 Tax=Tindallia magadiensis TaxID=69895 RepID=A0A1I3B4M2_9FIRM|nr:universal stress protein UspA [Tindallia magadiensis]SFH57046.1 Universal stress protein family protein [Tindallia magadiensis]